MTQAPPPTHQIDGPQGLIQIQSQVSLAELTTFRVGGPAEWFIAPSTLEDLQKAYAWAKAEDIPITMLGAGSNLLISDQGLPGLIISTKYLRHHSFDDKTGQVIADAGKSIPRLAWQAAQKGWTGLEWAVGIPGTCGGAVVMNAGAHRGCIADNLLEAHVLNPDGTLEILSTATLEFSYRSSILQTDQRPVVRAIFQLQPGDPQLIKETTQAHREHRLNTQPYDWPSCGSVFRNPKPKTAAGWLIEQSGLKGYQLGGAQVAEKHANFILNRGDATANDIFNLIRHVQHQVEQQWSFLLHPEVKMLGEFPQVA